MKSAGLLLAALVLAPGPCLADGPIDILRVYLSASDLVVLGRILNQPEGVFKEAGVPNYRCEFKVEDVLKGNSQLKGKTIKVNIIRFETDVKDHHPLIAKDARCILFLKEEETKRPSWETADFWFGVQHPFPWLVRSLKQASQRSAQEPGEKQRRQTLTSEDAVRLLVRDYRAKIDGTVPPRSWPEKMRKVGDVWVADVDTSRLPGGYPEQIAVEVTAAGGGTGRPKYAAIAGLPPDHARILLGRLLRFNLTWGLLARGGPLIPPLAVWNYLAQRGSISSQEAENAFAANVAADASGDAQANPYASPQTGAATGVPSRPLFHSAIGWTCALANQWEKRNKPPAPPHAVVARLPYWGPAVDRAAEQNPPSPIAGACVLPAARL